MRARWRSWIQFAVAAGAIVALAYLVSPFFSGLKRSGLPEGWLLLRPPHEISSLVIIGDIVWAGGRDGMVRIDAASGLLLPLPSGAHSVRHVRALLPRPGDKLLAAHSAGILECTPQACRPLPAPDSAWLALLALRDGALLASGELGLARFDGGSFVLAESVEKLGLKDPDVLFEDSKGNLYLGSSDPARGGLLLQSATGQWTPLHTRPEFPHPSVSMILEEASGALWFSTGFGRAGGAVRLHDGQWTALTKADGLAGEKARTLYQDRAGRLWIGSEYDGIVYGTPSAWTLLTPNNGLAGWEVKAIAEDSRGYFWMGTEDGISRMPPIPNSQPGVPK